MLGQSHRKLDRGWRLYFIAIILFTPCLRTHTSTQTGAHTDEGEHMFGCAMVCELVVAVK